MGFIYYNPNPKSLKVGDCVIRAISKLCKQSWETTYLYLAKYGYDLGDMPSSNNVWGTYLLDNGYTRHLIQCDCNYTVNDFCIDNPIGTYLLCTGSHAVTADSGNYYDTWDSGLECPIFYFTKEVDDGL